MATELEGEERTCLEAQWHYFLLTKFDPYAMSKYRILLDWLGDLTGKTVLVAGTGSGEMACLLALRGASVTAIDISREAIELTERAAKEFDVSLETAICALENMQPSGSFDVALATDVVEHIEDDDGAARHLSRLTKPGGSVVVTVPALQFLFGYHDEVLGHYRRYTKRSLSALFEPYVDLVRLRYFGFLLIPVALIVSRLLRRPYPIKEVGQTESKPSMLGRLLRLYFTLERKVRFPVGTSVLMLGRKRDD